MPEYLLLLYADEPTRAEHAARESQLEEWREFTDGLQEAGVLVGANRLMTVDAATTLRIRDGETDIVDGPFATTKELLGGYYLLECPDLDAAMRHAERCPLARYGSVEVRPVMYAGIPLTAEDEAAAGA
jgi:hypothetical protein